MTRQERRAAAKEQRPKPGTNSQTKPPWTDRTNARAAAISAVAAVLGLAITLVVAIWNALWHEHVQVVIEQAKFA